MSGLLPTEISLLIEKIKKDPSYQKEWHQKGDALDNLYSDGYHFYEKGHYDQALHSFFVLAFSHPLEAKYWFALASTWMQKGEWEKALNPWAVAALIDYDNPFPHFHAAECLFSLHLYEEGKKALQEAKKRKPDTAIENKIKALESALKGER